MSSVASFALVAAALVVAALAFVLPALRARPRHDEARRAAISSEIYQQELAELEAEAVRGEIGADELQAARQRLHQRLVDETHARAPAEPARSFTRMATLVVVIALPVVAALVYVAVGRPDALDEAPGPEAGADAGDYVTRLQAHLARQPRDGRGWVLLGRAEAERNAFRPAADAFQKAITVSEKIAKDPGVLCEYADALGMTQGGSLAGKPAELIEQALAIDPKHPVALEMAGSAAYERGRYADAVRYWKELLAGLTPGTDRYVELAAAVARAERKAAVSLPR